MSFGSHIGRHRPGASGMQRYANTMTGVGRNQPNQFVTGEFKPVTPLIDGAMMNGIGGTPDDTPDLKPGSWQTCEYWTPMVCHTMWLISELSAG